MDSPSKIILPGMPPINPNQPPPQVAAMTKYGMVMCATLCALCPDPTPAFHIFCGSSVCLECLKKMKAEPPVELIP